jgi:hypothetical protein
MAIIKETKKQIHGKGKLIHHWWDCKLFLLLWNSVWSSLKTLKVELPYDPVIPLLDIHLKKYLKESKSAYNRDTYISMFTAALFTIAKLWNQPGCPSTDE